MDKKLKHNLEFCEHANECKDNSPYICDETCSWNEEKAFRVEQDWDNDGMLNLINEKTLKRYHEICKERDNCNITAFDCFFAFSDEQFRQGLQSIRPLTDGEMLVRFSAGCYGTKDGVDKLCSYYDDMRALIANECNPFEVYAYEYNNHESFISWDGDMGAIQIIIDTFGIDVAKKIKRFSAQYTIEELSE